MWRHIASKGQGHDAVLLSDSTYLAVLAAIFHPVEGYVVTRPKIFV
jgi:hypothetical protein